MVSAVKKLLPGAAGTAGAGGGDDDFNLVTTLLHGDGSSGGQNVTFLDSSDNSLTVTAGSDVPAQGTFSPFSADEGKWSVEFDGSDDYLSLPDHSDFNFGSDDWTIEAFVNVDAISTSYKCIFSRSYGLQFYVYDDKLHLAVNDTNNTSGWMVASFSTAGQISTGVWHHVAAYRDGNNFYCSVDGVVSSMGSSSATIATRLATAGHYEPKIGVWANDTLPMDGSISNLRVVKGTALYGSSNFTAPDAALTAVTNTKLLTCCSNRFRDKSTSGHAISTNSTPKVQPFSPFKNSAAYDATVHGGSFRFEQNANSYLAVSHATLFDFGTADYCIEAWLYPTQTSFSNSWAMWASTIGVNQYWAYTDGGGNEAAAGFSNYPAGGYSASNSHILKPFEWSHCVFQNTGGYENWYLNGTRIYNVQNNPNHGSSATGMLFGRANNYPSYFYYGGYMSDLRVTTGANYNPYSNASTLTVPTAPLTKGSYTRLLLNGTNAKIIDVSGKNNIRTLDNTQLDTTIKKFGTASIEFDHTNDYLTLPTSEFIPFGNGDFTIECWAYFDSSPNGNGQGLFQLSNGYLNTSTRGPAVGCSNTTGKWGIYYGTSWSGEVGTATVPSINTWYHVALVRNSGTIKLYVDGVEQMSFSDTTNYTDTHFTIGGWYSTGYLMDGYIDDFRITHKARYTSNNFDVPTAAHPDI